MMKLEAESEGEVSSSICCLDGARSSIQVSPLWAGGTECLEHHLLFPAALAGSWGRSRAAGNPTQEF